jgi:hypothetical protein
MPDKDKPVTAQEAVEAYNTLRKYFKSFPNCKGCIFFPTPDCPECGGQCANNWPDIKEAPHA